MKSKINKKKINFYPSRIFLSYLLFFTFFLIISIFIYNEINNKQRFYNIIQKISEKYNYQLLTYELNSLNKVNKNEVDKIISTYLYKSIFLINLKELSNSIKNLKWVKEVNLSTNFKNNIEIEIFEYSPIGLFSFNNQLFYFSKEGKIIDKSENNFNENFIIFHGNQVLKSANEFLNIIKNIKKTKLYLIKEAHYINMRRWNIILHNEIIIKLSEKNIEESIKNYIKIIEKFEESKINSIKIIDLRNNEKAIISFK